MSISEKQIAANRANCRKSTGPRTPEGKAAASMNAVRHGFFARTLLLPSEDPAEFETFAAGLLDDLRPGGHLETNIATRLVATAWRLRRVPIAEAAIFSPDSPPSPIGPSAPSPDSPDLSAPSDSSANHVRPSDASTSPGAAYLRRLRPGTDPLAGISRHEARLHRQFDRDLQLFQNARALRLKRESEDRELAFRRAQDPNDPLYDPAMDPMAELRRRRVARRPLSGPVRPGSIEGTSAQITDAISPRTANGIRPSIPHGLGEGERSNQKAPAPLPSDAARWHGLPARDSSQHTTLPHRDAPQPSDENGFVFGKNAPPPETLDTLYEGQLRIERQLGLPETDEEVQAFV